MATLVLIGVANTARGWLPRLHKPVESADRNAHEREPASWPGIASSAWMLTR